jgi:hypothetical protein
MVTLHVILKSFTRVILGGVELRQRLKKALFRRGFFYLGSCLEE